MLSSTFLDELGYVPFDKAGADLLFGFISQRYERRSLVVTTNLPFARWSEVGSLRVHFSAKAEGSRRASWPSASRHAGQSPPARGGSAR